MKSVMVLSKAKETKGTVRFDYDGDRHEVAVPAIYVQKGHLTRPYPDQIRVTIEDV